MKINKSKHERQLEVISKWIGNEYKGTANLVMRFGKTLVGAMASEKVISNFNNDVVIVVPSEYIYRNWKDKFKEYKEGGIIKEDYIAENKVRIFTANEILSNNAKIKTECLIVDEIHKFTGEARIFIINGGLIEFDKCLGLTGTYPKDKLRDLRDTFGVFDTIEESEAIKRSWISNFIEYNIRLDLSDNDKVRYEKLSEPITETLRLFKGSSNLFKTNNGNSIFNDDYDVIQSCYSGKYWNGRFIEPNKIRESLARQMGWREDMDVTTKYGEIREKFWHPNNIFDRVKAFNGIIRDRNEVLINNPKKLDAVIRIFKRFPIPTICFSESTDFATKIGEEINSATSEHSDNGEQVEIATVYHSKVRRYMIDPETGDYFRYKSGAKKGEPKVFGQTLLKKDAIEGMKSGRYLFISTAKALDEGLDLPQLSQVITTSGTTNPTQYVQRNARGKSVDIYNPDKVTRIINLYFDDFDSLTRFDDKNLPVRVYSRDKRKLLMRQSNNKTSVLWLDDVDELS